MKRQINKKNTPGWVLRKLDLWLILIPSLLWLGSTYARSYVIHPKCAQNPQTCSKQSVSGIDRFLIGMEDSDADHYSYLTQNTSGALGLLVPLVWHTSSVLIGRIPGLTALAYLGADLVLVIETTTWNGFLTELSHLLSQRPRPFVYTDPAQRGTDTAHYTSFYSGHTSFTAAANAILFFILLARGAPWIILILSIALGEAFVLATAYFRILAGRHFLTDVICGAIAGTLVAWMIYRHHQSRRIEIKS
jgi:membrane-associated phospholipid phosphatase